MKLKEILAISGRPGLYRHVAKGRNGIIVESLADGGRISLPGTAKVNALHEIAIFTDGEEIPLWRIFGTLHGNGGGGAAVDPKSDPDTLKSAMAEVVPGYDRDRVHVSDIKKLFSWYNILSAAGMTDFTVEDAEDKTEE